MGTIGGLKQFEISCFNQIEECKAWLDKELAPLRTVVDQAITFVAQAIVNRRQDKLTTGIQRIDAVVDVFRTEVIKNQIIGLCWTVVRVSAVVVATFIVTHPFAKPVAALALLGHAMYKGLLAMEEADESDEAIEQAIDAALNAFLFDGILNPLSHAVDKAVEALHNAANDLQLAKELFISIGGCL